MAARISADLPFRQHQAGPVAGGGDLRPRPLDVVNHAYGDTACVDHPHGVGQPVARLAGVLVAPHRQHRRDRLQVVENAQALQIAAVQDEVNATEDF